MEKEELRSTFSQYISPNVLRYLEKNREAFKGISNKKEQVSILFCDIRGFTAYSQTHTPQESAKLLADYYAIANDIILNRYDGTINKLMGDGLMAYWGFPVPDADHAYTATNAAIAIIKAMEQYNAQATGDRIQVGIGIYTGEVVVGNIGSKDFMDFTLIGNPVNLASRLESVNKELNTRLLISEATYQDLRSRIRCKDHGLISIRGWNGQIQVYEPLF
jgi:adenylate cyclase